MAFSLFKRIALGLSCTQRSIKYADWANASSMLSTSLFKSSSIVEEKFSAAQSFGRNIIKKQCAPDADLMSIVKSQWFHSNNEIKDPLIVIDHLTDNSFEKAEWFNSLNDFIQSQPLKRLHIPNVILQHAPSVKCPHCQSIFLSDHDNQGLEDLEPLFLFDHFYWISVNKENLLLIYSSSAEDLSVHKDDDTSDSPLGEAFKFIGVITVVGTVFYVFFVVV